VERPDNENERPERDALEPSRRPAEGFDLYLAPIELQIPARGDGTWN